MKPQERVEKTHLHLQDSPQPQVTGIPVPKVHHKGGHTDGEWEEGQRDVALAAGAHRWGTVSYLCHCPSGHPCSQAQITFIPKSRQSFHPQLTLQAHRTMPGSHIQVLMCLL